MDTTETPAPRPASTLVLLRDEPEGFSVLLMKRPSRSSFMAGVHVFPGGRVEPEDAACPGRLPAQLAARMGLAENEARAYVSAALRETFEEMGVLLGERVPPLDSARARAALAGGELQWTAWEGSALDEEISLVYFDHWITPRIEPKRFDTRFFAARVPSEVRPEPNAEAIAWDFFTPAAALAEMEAGHIALAPPTLVTLMRLRAYASAGEALQGLGTRDVGPLEPHLAGGDPITLALPGHPAHPLTERKQDNPLAMRMLDGGWAIDW